MGEGSPTRYLYIVGRGHSGSTIFSMLVGESPNVASGGEIVIGFRGDYQAKRCANGEIFADSPFWSAVKSAFEAHTGRNFAEAVEFLNRHAYYSRVPARLLASSKSPGVAETKRSIEALYDSIAEVSARPVVLDSSKELSTAIFLLRHVPDAKLIHFVRSPFGVADSYVKRVKSAKSFHVFWMRFDVQRHYFLPMVISALLWTIESFVCELLRLRYPTRVMTIHYEDLCDRPIELLERVERFTGISLHESKAAAHDGRMLQPSHALSGNRLMRSAEILFSPKKGLPRHLTAFDRASVILCTFPMTLAYGYLGRRAIKSGVVMREVTH